MKKFESLYIYIYITIKVVFEYHLYIISENLKIHGVHFYIYGTMKLFTKVVWLYFVKVLVAFPISRHAHAPCAHPRARLSRDFIFSNFCGRNFVSREVTQRPRVKTKKPLVCRFMAFVFKFSSFSSVPFLSDEDFGPVEVVAIDVYFPLERLDSRMFREKNFDRGSSTFELVHMVLINRMVLLGTHGLHCLFSLVMENSCSRQLEFWAFLDTWIADCFVRHAWFALSVSFRGKFVAQGSWNFELVQLFLDSWIADCFVWHAWFALSVSSRGKFLARGSWNFELLELFLDIGIGLFC